MSTIAVYMWIIFLIIYIISPFDAHPLFFDDLIAAVALFFLLYKIARKKKQRQYYDYYSRSQSSGQTHESGSSRTEGPLTLDEAYRILDVSPSATLDEISRAYKERMSKSHPDKVSHLSQELQDKARELTLKINEAYELIKRQKA